MRQLGRPLLVVIVLTLASAAAGLAQHNPYGVGTVTYADTEWASVQRGDVVLLGLLDGSGEYTKQRRAEIVSQERLALLEQNDLLADPGRIEVGRIAGEVVVYVSNPSQTAGLGEQVLIVTVDVATAQKLGATRLGIAEYWRDLLRLYAGPTGSNPSALDPVGRPIVPAATWRSIPDRYRTMGAQVTSTRLRSGWGGFGCCGG